MFRAYFDKGGAPMRSETLNVSCSTTGDELYAVRRCAVKAFIKIEEPDADPDEIETRIGVEKVQGFDKVWRAELQGKATS